ncbi:flavin reductase family protein [Nocardia tengchongensis]|uniref:flavin reductase family protein n=1 Tax=Nocardia tengchongensis TaxID=2055889 RepID=UPI00368AF0B7
MVTDTALRQVLDRVERVRPAEHRDLMSHFPTGVTIVTATGPDGSPRGLTCTSLSSVTLDPPTLLVCLNRRSGTLDALRNGRFGVNLLRLGAQQAAAVFSRPVADRFTGIDWRPSPVLEVPHLVTDAFAFAGCVVRDSLVVGDHEIVLGEVCEIRNEPDEPLLYGMRTFSALAPVAAES